MRLWKRASGAWKDQSSLWQANLTRRHPDIDKAVIRATSHHDSPINRCDVERVCDWLRLSHLNLKPILRSLSARMEKTRSWPVALKGLLLTHALLNSPSPAVPTIGRLPFDLSTFSDSYTQRAKAFPFNAFVRSYYAFLDQKSATAFHLASSAADLSQVEIFALRRELDIVRKLQGLIDLLVEIKPAAAAAFDPLILDVMDGLVAEIYDVYGRICQGIAMVLLNIYTAGKAEAAAALYVVKKATQQGEELAFFFQLCKEIRVVNAADFPVIDRIPEEGIRELELIVERLSHSNSINGGIELGEKAIVVVREAEKEKSELKTVITDKWEKFEDDLAATSCAQQVQGTINIPDLITFL